MKTSHQAGSVNESLANKGSLYTRTTVITIEADVQLPVDDNFHTETDGVYCRQLPRYKQGALRILTITYKPMAPTEDISQIQAEYLPMDDCHHRQADEVYVKDSYQVQTCGLLQFRLMAFIVDTYQTQADG